MNIAEIYLGYIIYLFLMLTDKKGNTYTDINISN